ncbi:Ig-like domain-containing protein [Pseudocnuella soli]|uniref:Ig-like domain-containing protein n=1 Tax=Pseudocnuella soli TaxID=2502779 RepID=UPI0010502B60|nr:Ig-like domain-containing protein [Pseudocnuella soli]
MKQLIFLLTIVGALAVLQVTTGCANIIPPQGGPRDSLPPVLVEATPADSTVNFRGNRITLNFNEFVKLEEVQGNLLFMPIFENTPIVESRLRTISIRLRDSLEANTTYIFNFGNALRDENEGNILRNFTYRFSTGPVLDSLQLSGNVVMAESGKIDTTMIVVLHRSMDDSAVYQQRPRYVSRVDNAGNFRFTNLPRDSFAIYAIGDAGILRRYTNPAQAFAFADGPVVSGADSIRLYAYNEVAENAPRTTTTTPSASNTAADRRLRLSNSLVNGQQDLLTPLTITFERALRQWDFSKIVLVADSAYNTVPNYRWILDSSRKMLQLQHTWTPGRDYHLIAQQDFAEDSLGRKLLKADTISFRTKRTEDYGSINLALNGADTTLNPVLQFVQADKVVFSVPIKSGRFVQQLFLPGEYDLRLLYDRNGNGKWDPGQFFGVRRQPELVQPLGRKINVKGDWENEFTVDAVTQ